MAASRAVVSGYRLTVVTALGWPLRHIVRFAYSASAAMSGVIHMHSGHSISSGPANATAASSIRALPASHPSARARAVMLRMYACHRVLIAGAVIPKGVYMVVWSRAAPCM